MSADASPHPRPVLSAPFDKLRDRRDKRLFGFGGVEVAAGGLGRAKTCHTANTAILQEDRSLLIDNPHRFDGVPTIGVDEHVCWDGTEFVAMDGFTGFKPTSEQQLPDATKVMDPFYVVQIAGDALGFRNLARYFERSLLKTGGFRPRLHPKFR